MEHWLFLPQTRLGVDDVVELARAAEASGFTGLALIDHLVTPLAEDQPLHEAMTLATWVAAHTTTLRLGHLVLCDAFRHPAVLAKQAVTLDHASGGRFELGLGWGSWPRELTGFGVTAAPPRERAARLVSSVETVRALWAGEPAGEDALRQQPRPLGRLPLVVGGSGPTALRLAREHADWWNLQVTDLHRLDELAARVAPARVSVQLMVAPDLPGADPGAALDRARRWFPGFGDGIAGGDGPALRARLDDLAARGVGRVYVWFAPAPAPATLAWFGGEVVRR